MPPKMPRRILRFAVSSLLLGAPLVGCEEPEIITNPGMAPEPALGGEENLGEPEPLAVNPGPEEEPEPLAEEETEVPTEESGAALAQGTPENPAEATEGIAGDSDAEQVAGEPEGDPGGGAEEPDSVDEVAGESGRTARETPREESRSRQERRLRERLREQGVAVNPGPQQRRRRRR